MNSANSNRQQAMIPIDGKHFAMWTFILLLLTGNYAAAGDPLERFFLMGSGKLQLHNLRNNRQASVSLLTADGSFADSAFATVDEVFGFPDREKGEHISPRLLFMLSYFVDRVAPGKTVNIESAYRSPQYNEKLRAQGANAARTSSHIDGMALDFWIDGVDGKLLWEMVRNTNCCGVGHYGGKTIHLDAGRPRFWEAATSGTGGKEPDYNRHVYLSTEYDRYRAGENVRLSLSGLSNFDFGIRPQVTLYSTEDTGNLGLPVKLQTDSTSDCLQLDTRKASRFISTTLPASLDPGRYSLELSFCNRPFPEMPDHAKSLEFEVPASGGN